MRIGSLFSGIGGLELGLERAGVGDVVWQVEKSAFCRQKLARHWPNVARYRDVRNVGQAYLYPVDLICGGFPCQPFSTASRGRKVAEDLWPQMLRIIKQMRPRFVVAENVACDPIKRAAADLREESYAATSIELSAAMVGAPHERVRWFMVADANGNCEPRRTINEEVASVSNLAEVFWQDHSQTLGMDDGIPYRMDRLRALGNAVVPRCAEVVGHIINQLKEPQCTK